MRKVVLAIAVLLTCARPAPAEDLPSSSFAVPDPQQPSSKGDVPYTEGWRAGSPPGDHVAARVAIVGASARSELEFSLGPRVGGVSTRALGQPKYVPIPQVGIELYGTGLKNKIGDLGWVSLDYWQISTSGTATITKDANVSDTRFVAGDQVRARLDQRFIILRDGLDIRYRFPIGKAIGVDGVSLDVAFGPALLLGMRSEHLDVHALFGARADGGVLWSVSLVPGGRASVELHLPLEWTIRVGGDLDFLPPMHHNPLSFTRAPSVDGWFDLHAFFAVRWSLVEVSAGWRHFETQASGGRVRQGDVSFQGFQATVSLRF